MTLMIASASALADDPARLPKDEVKRTIEGKTMVYTAPNGAPQRVYYSADGSLIGRVSGTSKALQSAGEWTVEEDGKICQKIKQGPMNDRCYYLMRADGALSISINGNRAGTPITLE